MNNSTIEDLEIILENSWPLRWVSILSNDQFDYKIRLVINNDDDSENKFLAKLEDLFVI